MTNQNTQTVAIIGAGITGLSCAYHLYKNNIDFTIFEKNNYIGGHSNTVETPCGTPVDTGFIVYNEWTYPNLINFFDELGVETETSDMSFAVSMDQGDFEYAGDSLNTLFGQKSNLLRPRMYRMIWDLIRFYKNAPKDYKNGQTEGTLGNYLKIHKYSDTFIKDHLIPMGSAIWSMAAEEMMNFPASSFIRFCINHGLLLLSGRPEWRTVKRGSREYVKKITNLFPDKIQKSDAVAQVAKSDKGLTVKTLSGAEKHFDHVVFACHGDQILDLYQSADKQQNAILSAFEYSMNKAYLHTDETLMPQRKKLWASWNYIGQSNHKKIEDTPVFVSYWMNRLQNYDTDKNFFVSLNPFTPPKDEHIIKEISYEHPLFSPNTNWAQKRLREIQGRNNVWYCGAWCGYGFHEDGASAGFTVAEQITHIKRPWNITEKSTAKENCTAYYLNENKQAA